MLEGLEVVCMDELMGSIGSVLTKDKVYKIKEFVPVSECARLFPDHFAEWHKNKGRVELEKLPGLYWYGRRFAFVGEFAGALDK